MQDGRLMRLILIGPPGSGKGTQAELLGDRLGLTYIGTGDILRDAIRRGTALGKRVEPLDEAGAARPRRRRQRHGRRAVPRRPTGPSGSSWTATRERTPRPSRSTPCSRSSSSPLDAVVILTIAGRGSRAADQRPPVLPEPRPAASAYNVNYRPPKAAGDVRQVRLAADPARRRQGRDRPPPARRVPQEHGRADRALPASGTCCARSPRPTRSRRSTRTS